MSSPEPLHPPLKLRTGVHTAVVVIDMQNELVHPDGEYYQAFPFDLERPIEAVRRLVTWARHHHSPVIWLRLAFRSGHFDAVYNSMSRQSGRLVDGDWGADIRDDLGRDTEDVVVTRKRPSGFFDTDLNIVLRGLAIRQLIVAGGSTHWAVESTVRDGHSHDYEEFVVEDAVIDPFPDFHDASLRSMASVFATVASLEDIVSL